MLMIKCNTCKHSKPLSLMYFTQENGKYRTDKCKQCIRSKAKIQIKIKKAKAKKKKKIINLGQYCIKCEEKREFKHFIGDMKTCQFCIFDRIVNQPDYNCGVCDSSTTLTRMISAVHCPTYLCNTHYLVFQPIKQRLTKYNLHLLEYLDMLEIQDNKCKLCNIPSNDLVIDHCHETSKVRALLCNKCNTYAGFIESAMKSGLLTTTIKYIKKHKALNKKRKSKNVSP